MLFHLTKARWGDVSRTWAAGINTVTIRMDAIAVGMAITDAITVGLGLGGHGGRVGGWVFCRSPKRVLMEMADSVDLHRAMYV